MTKFIFDVDGTLTPSRQSIDRKFSVWFKSFCENNDVYLVTGSDRIKTIEQIGEVIYNKCKVAYQCSGAECWKADRKIYTSDWVLGHEEQIWLENELAKSSFTLRTGYHIEHRPGCVNFSIVGRGATDAQRQAYIIHDEELQERRQIADSYNKQFPDSEATVGGETGLDIGPKGSNKSQILKDFKHQDVLAFFGDRMEPGGNDYPLADAIEKHQLGFSHHVKDWQETWFILKNKYTHE